MNAPKKRGTAWESEVVAFLRYAGFPALRRALAGSDDRGDVSGVPGVVIEAKNCRQLDLAAWVSEAEAEKSRDNAEFAVVWHKRRGKASAADAYVTMTGATFVAFLQLLHAPGSSKLS